MMTVGEPIRSIGGAFDDPSEEFNHSNGFLSGTELSGGNFVVIDESRVRFYSPDDRLIGDIGHAGSGPGEFRLATSVCESIVGTTTVFDLPLQRVSVIADADSIERQFPVEEKGGLAEFGCLSDGSVLLFSMRTGRGPILRVAPSGLTVDTVAFADLPTLTRRVSIVADGDVVWIANPQERTVRRLVLPSRSETGFLLNESLVAMTEEEVRRTFPVGRAAGPKPRSGPERAENPQYWPLHERALPDGAGGIWLQDAVRDLRAPVYWTWVDSVGQIRGRIEFRREAHLLPVTVVQFLPGAVWVLRRDEEGLAYFEKRLLSDQL